MYTPLLQETKNSNLFDEQLLFYRKSTYQNIEQKEKDILVIFIFLLETKNSNLLDKNCTKEYFAVKFRIQHEKP